MTFAKVSYSCTSTFATPTASRNANADENFSITILFQIQTFSFYSTHVYVIKNYNV